MNLVDVNDYGIKGVNHYWSRRDDYSLTYTFTTEELNSVGITGNNALVDESLVSKLQEVNKLLKSHDFEIIVKDGYRSNEMYELVRKKRYESEGSEITDRTLSTGSNPHNTGCVIDVSLVDLKTGKEVQMWDKADWPDGIFVDFYQNSENPRHIKYQKLQDLLIDSMQKFGFKLGSRKEIHHFDYSGDLHPLMTKLSLGKN